MRFATPVLLCAAAVLAACARVSPAEQATFCQTIDWHDYGENDGRLGVPEAERADLFAKCRELGHTPDLAAYQAGRAEGLKEYCSVETGYEVGRDGRRYRGVCPPETEVAFLQGYEEGREASAYTRYRYYPRYHFGFGHHHFGFHHFGHYYW